MISVFRQIRKQFIEQGETSKYLKHALGEVILIVIGILIALSVNNWNESRQLRMAELKVYQNLKEQLNIDYEDIEGQLKYNAFYMAQYQSGIKIIEQNDRDKMDTLAEIIGQLTSYSDFDRRGNIYENMVNSGEIRLIRNEHIINTVIDLEDSMLYMNRMENIHYEAMMGHAIGAMKGVMKFSTGEVKKPEEIYSYKFQNLFYLFNKITVEKETVYKQVLEDIDNLNVMLDEELTAQ